MGDKTDDRFLFQARGGGDGAHYIPVRVDFGFGQAHADHLFEQQVQQVELFGREGKVSLSGSLWVSMAT